MFTEGIRMKVVIVLMMCATAALSVPADSPDKYTDRYDKINLDDILGNKRLLTAYVKCAVDKDRCTPEGKTLREHLGDALKTGCAKCTKAQNDGSERVINHLIEHDLDLWKELVDFYDKDGTYRKQYEDRARAKGIVIPAY